MNLEISLQSLKNIFRFPFQDPNWLSKTLIGSGLVLAGMIVPVIPSLPLAGYLARLVRAGAANEDPSRLPEWDDWGDLFIDGLRMMGVMLIGLLPGLLVMIFGWVVYMVGVFSMSLAQPGRASAEPVLGFFGSLLVFFLALGIGTLLLIVAGVALPPAIAHVAVKRRFEVFLQVREWFKVLRANWLGFLVVFAIFGALYFFIITLINIMYFTLVLCALIPFVLLPLGFYSGVILYRLIGQAYGEGLALAEGLPASDVPGESSGLEGVAGG